MMLFHVSDDVWNRVPFGSKTDREFQTNADCQLMSGDVSSGGTFLSNADFSADADFSMASTLICGFYLSSTGIPADPHIAVDDADPQIRIRNPNPLSLSWPLIEESLSTAMTLAALSKDARTLMPLNP